MLFLGIVCVFGDSQRNILYKLQGKQLLKDQNAHSLSKPKTPVCNHLTNFGQLISLLYFCEHAHVVLGYCTCI
jgi:hypothetical protein